MRRDSSQMRATRMKQRRGPCVDSPRCRLLSLPSLPLDIEMQNRPILTTRTATLRTTSKVQRGTDKHGEVSYIVTISHLESLLVVSAISGSDWRHFPFGIVFEICSPRQSRISVDERRGERGEGRTR